MTVGNALKGMLHGDDSATCVVSNEFKFVSDGGIYSLKYLNNTTFAIIFGQVLLRSSFRLMEKWIVWLNLSCALSSSGNISEEDVPRIVMELAAISLQTILKFLANAQSCAYSVAFYASIDHGESCIDVQIRFCTCSELKHITCSNNSFKRLENWRESMYCCI